jgi:hypothetical protein
MNDAISYRCSHIVPIADFFLLRLDVKLIALRAGADRMDMVGIPERTADYTPSQGLSETHCLLGQILLDHWALAEWQRGYCGKETGCRIMQRTSCLPQK